MEISHITIYKVRLRLLKQVRIRSKYYGIVNADNSFFTDEYMKKVVLSYGFLNMIVDNTKKTYQLYSDAEDIYHHIWIGANDDINIMAIREHSNVNKNIFQTLKI